MGIFDFFRRKKIQEPEVEPEEIGFDEIENWLSKKTKEVQVKEKKVFEQIREKIDLFIKEIREKTKVLEEVDIEAKKVGGRAKIIARQGLDKYMNFVCIFTKELTEVEKQNLSQFIDDVNKIFSDFDKHSYIFYQRATFLIGDEIATVKQEINNLSKYFTELFDENQKIVDSSEVISSTKLKLRHIDETNAALDKINLEIKLLDKKIGDGREKEKKVLCEIDKVKTSKDYAENLKKLERVKIGKEGIEEDAGELRGLVDFKALSNAFHSDKDKMEIIKSYKEDFQESIAKDSGDSILSLINEAGLDSNIIADKIKKINEKKQKIAEDKKLIKKDEIKILSEEVQKIKSEIEGLSIEKVKHVKRMGGVKESKGEIRELVKMGIKELGGDVI